MSKSLRSFVIALAGFAVVALVSVAGRPASPGFSSVWHAAQVMTLHQNPYSSPAANKVQPAPEFETAQIMAMSVPPYALGIIFPIGFLSARVAFLIWMLAALCCLAVCLQVFGSAGRNGILAYCFAPVLACLAGGGLAPFVVLGFSLFVWLHRRRPLFAGASLLLLMVEPRLLFVIAPVMLLDFAYRRNWRVLVGAATSVSAASLLAIWFDRDVWSHYALMVSGHSLPAATVPSPLMMVHVWIASRSHWTDAAPQLAAIVCALCFYWSKRRTWDWSVDAVLLLFVTILAAPVSSLADQVLLLPAMLITIGAAARARYTATWFVALNAVVLTLVIAQVRIGTGLYLAISAAWFGWYLYSRGGRVEAHARHYGAQMVQA